MNYLKKMHSENNYINKKDDHQESLRKLFHYLKENISSTEVKKTKNYLILIRKLYKYTKENSNYLSVNFSQNEDDMLTKTSFLFIDPTYVEIKQNIKEWILVFYQYINHAFLLEHNSSNSNDTDSSLEKIMISNLHLYLYILTSFMILKETCNSPPYEEIKQISNINSSLNRFLVYELSEYYIILNQKKYFIDNYNSILAHAKNSSDIISFKYFVLIKKICLKFFDDFSKGNKVIPNEMSEFISLCINSMKINFDINQNNPQTQSYFSYFTNFLLFKNRKNFQPKELDGSNINDILTILNVCDNYSNIFSNNVVVFSISYEFFNFIYKNKIEINAKFKDFKSMLYSYCIRIFDQSENYLESNKNKTIQDTNYLEYNLNLIEGTVLENLKIINLICKLEPSLTSIVHMRMKQVYERIAMRQSGVCLIEILQFFFDNHSAIIVDLDFYVSEFFRMKLCYNYKNEILAYYTLNFLYKNKTLISSKTNIFITFFPIIIKLFSFFPKYISTKFFELIDYITQPETISELFNYFLDLPGIVLIIENFERYNLNSVPQNDLKNKFSDMFQGEYVKLVELLIRNVSYEKEYQYKINYYSIYDKQMQLLFSSLVFTSRVLSTTKIVPKLIHKFFNVIIQRDEIANAIEITNLIFERFSNFHGGESFKKEIRALLIKKVEQMFRKWPKIVTELNEVILNEIKNNFNNIIKRELINFLLWSLGEFLSISDSSTNSLNDIGIKKAFDCLEEILIQNTNEINSKNKNKESYFQNLENDDNMTVHDLVFQYSTYFVDKTTEEEISDERIINVLIDTLAKLSFKFKSYTGRILKCFMEIKRNLSNSTILEKINEMMVQFENTSIQTEYLI